MRSPELFFVYSNERNAFWKTDRCGYTKKLSDAGIYTEAESLDILNGANVVREEEVRIPLSYYLQDIHL